MLDCEAVDRYFDGHNSRCSSGGRGGGQVKLLVGKEVWVKNKLNARATGTMTPDGIDFSVRWRERDGRGGGTRSNQGQAGVN